MTKESLPYFLRDFHDQKDFVNAFYTWLEMMDKRQELDFGRKFDDLHQRRVDTCSWVDFHILFISCLDFMWQIGFRVQWEGGPDRKDFYQAIDDLKTLPIVFTSIANPDEILAFNEEYCIKVLLRWRNWWKYMPEHVQKFVQEKLGNIPKSP